MQKVKEFFKKNSKEIILAIFIILISILSFALGFIVAKFQEKKPLKIEKNYESCYRWCWNNWPLFS
jgi:hypothetical protein